jgi:hypothetical protein
MAAVALFALCASASAASSLHVRTATDTTATGGLLSATAHCPADEHVVSGGFSGAPLAYVLSSYRSDPRSWTVVLDANSEGPDLTVSAYCSSHIAPSVASKSGTITASGNRLGGSMPSCNGADQVVAGGFKTVEPSADRHEISAYVSRRADAATWQLKFVDIKRKADFIAYAYCTGHELITYDPSQSDSFLHNAQGSVASQCPTGFLLAGGYATSPKPDYYDAARQDLYYSESERTAGETWSVTGHNFSNVGGTLTAYAYCQQP